LSDKVLTIWSGHQTFIELMNADLHHFNFIALPEYSIKSELIRKAQDLSNVIPLPTVPIIIDFDDNRLAYEEFSFKSLIPNSGKYLMVFLGGDAPDENNVLHKIIDNEIENFALYAAHIASTRNLEIVVSNNPRTTKEQAEIFFKKLDEHKAEVAFFNFHDGVSAYKPLLHLLKTTDSVAMISGESTSMVDEIVGIAAKPAYVVVLSSMSAVHIAHVNYENNLGNIATVNVSEFRYDIPAINDAVSFERSSADIIAGEVLSKYYLGSYCYSNQC
jgi:mitochondrial fission protein ELM1